MTDRPAAPTPRNVRPALRTLRVLLALLSAAAFAAAERTHAASAAEPPAGGAAAGRPPNIVFILADDLGINDLSCYGRKDQPTSNLDRLAAEGIRFTNGYAAAPVCSPTRAALLTGKSPARLHLTTFLPGRADAPSQLLLHPAIAMRLPTEEVTLAERLKAAGYATGCFGKWHLGGKGFMPTDQGFDVYHPGKANTKPSATEGGKGEYDLTAAAESFIEANRARPFFLYLPHNNPHIPLAAKPELIEKHKASYNPMYAAVVETLDDCVGRIVAKVDALGLGGDTLIVFASDNGGLHVNEMAHTPATHNTPYRAGKGFCYEGGLRVPLIARWTGKAKAGTTEATPNVTTDWMPTLLEVAGVKTADPFDGVSLAGLLTGGPAPKARPLFWHFPHYSNQGSRPSGAVREGDWKLIEHYEDGRCELFNLAADPGEADDVSAKNPAKVAELRGKLEKWRRESGAQSNAANPKFNASLWKPLYADHDPSKLPAGATAAETAAATAEWRKRMNAAVAGRAVGGEGKDAKEAPKEPAKAEAKAGENVAKPVPTPDGPGAVILHARDAKVTSKKLRYEDPPHKDTLGFWVDAGDSAAWEFEPPSAATFEVELLVGCGKGSAGAQVEVTVGGKTLTFTVPETGHFQRFVPVVIGTVPLEAGKTTLTVRAKSKPGPAVMDLRRVTLRGVAG